jgi:hypothetical protein
MYDITFIDNIAVFWSKYKKNCLKIRCSRGAVGWDTPLQADSLRVRFPIWSLGFLIDIILPSALWPWGRFSLGTRRWKTSCADCLEILGVQPPGPLRACPGLCRDGFTFHLKMQNKKASKHCRICDVSVDIYTKLLAVSIYSKKKSRYELWQKGFLEVPPIKQ